MSLKVVVTDYIEADLDWEAGEMAKRNIRFEAYQLKFKPEAEVLEKLRDADVIVVNMVKLTESLISKLEKCRLIIRHGIGYDNVDVAACTKYGIQFAYQPDYCKEDVAEHAIALIFACARKVVRSRKTLEESSVRGQWDFTGLFPIYRLDGKTLGILGVGRIGSRVFRKLRTFGFRIIASDPLLSDKHRKELEAEGLELVDQETLFRESDFITVHTPLQPSTRHIVNAEMLALMKPTAYLVNTSRGPMVDTAALADAVRNKCIAGAAIDVFDQEPPDPSFELFKLENVILTPHIGWASEEAGWEIRKSIVNDILAAAEGRAARCVVNEIKDLKVK
ncbi:MAG: C-terminal binding protein [Victivallales bacterium]|nr:C-terminal binding protein [Victivallales bacterium]